MSKVAIMTDSNCGFMPDEGEKLGISVIPMPIIVDDRTYYEGVDISSELFYQKMKEGAHISTSQPSAGDVMDAWRTLLKEYEEVVFIPMSGGLSSACASAAMLSQEEEFAGKVHVVDNHRISVTQAQSVLDAAVMARQGYRGGQIKEMLEAQSMDATIYIAVDTLEYLKKGGRVTPAAAAIGSVLHIKPVLTIQGGKLDAFAKVRGTKAAFKTMCKRLEEELHTRFASLYHQGMMKAGIANTLMDEAKLEEFKAAMREHFPDLELFHLPLTMSIATHVGPGSLGIGLVRCCQEEIAGEI